MRRSIVLAGATAVLGFIVGWTVAPHHGASCIPIRYLSEAYAEASRCKIERSVAIQMCKMGFRCTQMEP